MRDDDEQISFPFDCLKTFKYVPHEKVLKIYIHSEGKSWITLEDVYFLRVNNGIIDWSPGNIQTMRPPPTDRDNFSFIRISDNFNSITSRHKQYIEKYIKLMHFI